MQLIETVKKTLVPIHKEGHIFILIFGVITAVLMNFSEALGSIGLVLTAWCVYFFRDPARIVPQQEGIVVSPADGVVSEITRIVPPAELNLGTEPLTRISIFLNVFNVHINRVPIAGTITTLEYKPGKFLSADLDKASEENERQSCVVTTEHGEKIGFIQIAGLVARRIVCDLTPQQKVQTGEKFGLIRFGSRCDVFLPNDVTPLVGIGQTMIGGESVLADLHATAVDRRFITQK